MLLHIPKGNTDIILKLGEKQARKDNQGWNFRGKTAKLAAKNIFKYTG